MSVIPSIHRSAVIALLLLTSVALLLAQTTLATADGIAVYADKATWESAVARQFETEDFSDAVLNPGVSFVSTASGHINPAQECYQDVLASESASEPQTTWSFDPQITAYGGNWTLGGPGGSGNSLLVYLNDSVYVGFISNSYSGGFWGFTSETPFTSVRLVGASGTNQQNYSLDDMVYSQVPEPVTFYLLGIGLVAVVGTRKTRPR